jgi:hypothetical protein
VFKALCRIRITALFLAIWGVTASCGPQGVWPAHREMPTPLFRSRILPIVSDYEASEISFPQFPLSTVGRYVVDARGKRFKLKAVNWYGSHLDRQVPGGLDQKPIAHIVALIKEWGFNTVRLPFSNQMLTTIGVKTG